MVYCSTMPGPWDCNSGCAHAFTTDRKNSLTPGLFFLRYGRLGVEGSKFIDQLAAGVVGGRDDGSMGRKGVVKERLLLIVSVTTQVTIWRRVP